MAKYAVRTTSNGAYYIYRRFLWIWWNVGYINNKYSPEDALAAYKAEKVFHVV